ncbi:MAG: hypothetical protein K2Y21_01645 [Phycisphaerales bacterium]|nr:hypothetical protein [Phycisphaerales bacterium]
MAHRPMASFPAWLLMAVAGSQSGLAAPIFQADATRVFNFAGGCDFSVLESDGVVRSRRLDFMTMSRTAGAALPVPGTPIFLDHDEHVTFVMRKGKGTTRLSMDATIQELLSADSGNRAEEAARLFRAENLRAQAVDLSTAGNSFRFRFSQSIGSVGSARYEPTAGGFLVEASFEVFFDVSVDDGATWQTIATPLSLALIPAPSTALTILVPCLALAGRRRRS